MVNISVPNKNPILNMSNLMTEYGEVSYKYMPLAPINILNVKEVIINDKVVKLK